MNTKRMSWTIEEQKDEIQARQDELDLRWREFAQMEAVEYMHEFWADKRAEIRQAEANLGAARAILWAMANDRPREESPFFDREKSIYTPEPVKPPTFEQPVPLMLQTCDHPCTRVRLEKMRDYAMPRYHARFDSDLYRAAVQDNGDDYAERGNALIDEALALCGHPYYSASNTAWTLAELAFLVPFTKEWGV